MTSGRMAILGSGYSAPTSGSVTIRSRSLRPIATPSRTPVVAPTARPAPILASVSEPCSANAPSRAISTRLTAIRVGGGK